MHISGVHCDRMSLSITPECGIINIYHTADHSQPFYQRLLLLKECFCSVSLSACFSTNAEHSMIDLSVDAGVHS